MRNLSGQPTGGPSSKGLTRGCTCSNSGRCNAARMRCLHRRANLESFCDYDALREEVVRELLIERQIEADGAAADVEGPVFNIGVALQDFLEVINHLARGIDRGPLRQRQVNKQFWTV